MTKFLKKIASVLLIVSFVLGVFFVLFQFRHELALSPIVAHAQHTLHDDLSPNTTNPDSLWIFNGVNGNNSLRIGVWNLLLGLANAFVALVLFFFAFVNIAHIQYDTYQLKKVLPNLIIGIVLANFSMLICRLMVDIASVLTVTFVQQPGGFGNPPGLADDLMCAIFIQSSSNGAGGFATNFAAAYLTGSGLGLILIVLIAIIIMIGILLLSLLLWVRKVVIYLLAATSPLAFIMMAFPPTESYFKKWWDWEIKYVFMGPIIIFIIWLGSKIGATNCGGTFSLTALFATVGLVYLAAIIPFLLGGGAMALAQRVGQGVGHAAVNNPFSQRLGRNVRNRFMGTRLGRTIDGLRQGHELEMQTLDGERQAQRDRAMAGVRRNRGERQTIREAEIAHAKNSIEEVTMELSARVKEGTFQMAEEELRQLTGEGSAIDASRKYMNQARNLRGLQERLSKNDDLDLQVGSEQDLREDGDLQATMSELHAAGLGMETNIQEDGTVGEESRRISWTRANQLSEELLRRAKTEENDDRRAELENSARTLRQQATTYQTQFTSQDQVADRLNQRVAELNTEIEAAEAAGDEERVTTLTATRDAAQQAATLADSRRGRQIGYANYLSRNAGGRRMKILNPAVADEIHTQVISTPAQNLVGGIMRRDGQDQTVGTSEFRVGTTGFYQYVNGNIHELSESEAYAAYVQMGAIHEVMVTSRRGDSKGLNVVHQFNEMMQEAGREDFKVQATRQAMGGMSEDAQRHLLAQLGTSHEAWRGMSEADQNALIAGADFRQLTIKGQGAGAAAGRDFIDRYLNEVEADQALGISESAGSVLRRSRPTPPNRGAAPAGGAGAPGGGAGGPGGGGGGRGGGAGGGGEPEGPVPAGGDFVMGPDDQPGAPAPEGPSPILDPRTGRPFERTRTPNPPAPPQDDEENFDLDDGDFNDET